MGKTLKELAKQLRDAEDTTIGRQYGEWSYFKFADIMTVAEALESA